MNPVRWRVPIFALLLVLPLFSGCEYVDSEVLAGFRAYFPKAEIEKYNPRILHIETKVGNVSEQFIARTFTAFAKEPEFQQLRQGMTLAGYQYLVLGFEDRNVVWDTRVTYAQVMDVQRWTQWLAYTFGSSPNLYSTPATMSNLARSQIAANEALAVGSMRTVSTAAVTYSTMYGSYPGGLSNIGPGGFPTRTAANLIDSSLAAGRKSGYTFVYTPGTTDVAGNVLDYVITAAPIIPGTTGQRYFFSDQSGVIRANSSGAATAVSTPIS